MSDTPVTTIPLIGPKYAQNLEKLRIRTVIDLLEHYPKRYVDTRKISAIADIAPAEDEIYTVKGTIEKISSFYTRNRKFLVQATITDASGKITAIWFNQRFLTKTIKKGTKLYLSGKVKEYNGKVTFFAPEFEVLYKGGKPRHLGKISPVYPLTQGVTQKWLRGRIAYTVENIAKIPINNVLPAVVMKERKFEPRRDAIRKAHSPKDEKEIESARQQLGFEELFVLMTKMLRRRNALREDASWQIKIDNKIQAKLRKSFGFEFTKAQDKAVKEIFADLAKTIPMDRLLSGDVGSGKTAVALSAMIQVAKHGQQAVLMAPTTILAEQHYKKHKERIEKLGFLVALVTGNTKPAKGTDILIGTQAILHRPELLKNTALIIVDEQHRFGVKQRDQLLEQMKKLPLPYSPHRLTLTATPIPRTMALVFFGDQDVSTLDSVPAGRKKIKTTHLPEKKRTEVYAWLTKYLAKKGNRAFVVCPLIEESDNLQTKAVQTEFAQIKKAFPKQTVGLLHGKMKAEEKAEAIKDFEQNKSQILVATPVIEVGIDIADANVMIIEGAERFGLAQLHQLRGRIGRGTEQAYCFVSIEKRTKTAVDRIKYFCETTSGLRLAKYDLKLRGPGEVYGTRQSGIVGLKIASLSDLKLLGEAKKAAEKHLATGRKQ